MKGKIGGSMRMSSAVDAGVSFKLTKWQRKYIHQRFEKLKALRKLDAHAEQAKHIDLRPRLIKPT